MADTITGITETNKASVVRIVRKSCLSVSKEYKDIVRPGDKDPAGSVYRCWRSAFEHAIHFDTDTNWHDVGGCHFKLYGKIARDDIVPRPLGCYKCIRRCINKTCEKKAFRDEGTQISPGWWLCGACTNKGVTFADVKRMYYEV